MHNAVGEIGKHREESVAQDHSLAFTARFTERVKPGVAGSAQWIDCRIIGHLGVSVNGGSPK